MSDTTLLILVLVLAVPFLETVRRVSRWYYRRKYGLS